MSAYSTFLFLRGNDEKGKKMVKILQGFESTDSPHEFKLLAKRQCDPDWETIGTYTEPEQAIAALLAIRNHPPIIDLQVHEGVDEYAVDSPAAGYISEESSLKHAIAQAIVYELTGRDENAAVTINGVKWCLRDIFTHDHEFTLEFNDPKDPLIKEYVDDLRQLEGY